MTPAQQQIEAVAARLGPGQAELLLPVLGEHTWGLWCTLYVDSSNAGGGKGGGASWGWGARGRMTDAVAAVLGVSPHFRANGPAPEAHGKDSGVAELWGVVYAVRHALLVWPWLAGVGIRCDNAEAVRNIPGCDGRPPAPPARERGGKVAPSAGGAWSPKVTPRLEPARAALAQACRPIGLLLRATHVHGHGGADKPERRNFNAQADQLARSSARRANKGGG